jgi:hypothetical protein
MLTAVQGLHQLTVTEKQFRMAQAATETAQTMAEAARQMQQNAQRMRGEV